MTEREKEEIQKKIDSLYIGDDLHTFNIIVAGKTGAGKSTLINAVFGSDLAPTGIGRPITENIEEYEDKNQLLHIWDTVGLELDPEKTKKSIASINKIISDKADSNDIYDRIHAIWYCICEGIRYEGAELDFIQNLHDIGIPFVIVLTQCIDEEEEANKREKIIIDINSEKGMDDIDVIQVLAQDYKVRNFVIPQFGIDKLVDHTLKIIPENIRKSFIAAQKINLDLKKEEGEKCINKYVKKAKENFWANIIIANVWVVDKYIKKMFVEIGDIFNKIVSKEQIDETIKKMGSIDIKRGFYLIAGSNKVNNEIKKKFQENKDMAFKVDVLETNEDEKAARLVAFFGYVFIDTMLDYWKKFHRKKLKELDRKNLNFADMFIKNFRILSENKQ